MKIIEASYDIVAWPQDALQRIEAAGRTCYKSEDRTTETSASAFVRRLVESHHESVLEHVSATVRFIVDRATSHQLVRHRLMSVSQESQRYCDYEKKGLIFVRPCQFRDGTAEFEIWRQAMSQTEQSYLDLRDSSAPQAARSVLPNSTKTELVVTANFRQWRHILRERTSHAADLQMRGVMLPLREEMAGRCPEVFGVINA